MSLSEMRKEPHLSSSAINDYLECGLLFKFGRIEKIEPVGKSDALELGSVLHRVLAEFHFARMLGERLPDFEVDRLFEEYWQESVEDTSSLIFRGKNSVESLLAEGKKLLSTYLGNLPRDEFRVLAIEEPFRFEIPGLPIPIIGAMDLIEEDATGTIIVSDFKTSLRAYSEDQIRKHFQMTVYFMALREQGYRDREILLRIDCLVKTKTPRFEQYYTARGRLDEVRARRKILEAWEGISKGVFLPNDGSWRCKYCSFKARCDRWFESSGNAPAAMSH